jgi:hypothetical protein
MCVLYMGMFLTIANFSVYTKKTLTIGDWSGDVLSDKGNIKLIIYSECIRVVVESVEN